MIRKEILSGVIESQRNWILHLEKGILREKIKDIKFFDSFAFVITGIRRCGKSTMLSQILNKQKKFYYLNLEDPRLEGFELGDFNRADEIFKELYGQGGIYFFDEVQNIPKWESFIRFLTDKKETIVLTGSNASLLSRELGTKLTGRNIQLELYPFSYREFLKLQKLNPGKKSFEEYLIDGGFPEFLKRGDKTILQELLKDVVMRDIVNRYGIKNTSVLRKLAIYLISHAGKEFSHNSLKRMFEIKSVQSIIDYVSYLEDSYLIFTVPKFSYSYKKQQMNPKKVYSIDNGLSNANSITFSEDKGKMLENSVFLELKRRYQEIFYYQKSGECDFLVKEKGILGAIQVCYELNDENEKREINGLLEALKELKLKEGLILTYDQEDEYSIEGKKIAVKPVWKWLEGDLSWQSKRKIL